MLSNSPFIVAEVSANHLGSLKRAKAIVIEAAKAGADAVKFQTFTPEQMVGPKDFTLTSGPWAVRKLLDLYREAHTPREWHRELFDLARSLDIIPFSTPFHPDDVAFLETLDCPIYKIASFEITDHELIAAAASTGKTVIISAGMASISEIISAQVVAEKAGAKDVVMMRCVSAYPARPEDANLATLRDGPYEGISDHTPGIGVAVAAAALGARVIEKHLTLSRACGGPDAAFSMEPHEFAQMVTECRRAAAAIGQVKYGPGAEESASMELRRSLWYAADLPAGTILTREHIQVARPFGVLPASMLNDVVGSVLVHGVKAWEAVTWSG